MSEVVRAAVQGAKASSAGWARVPCPFCAAAGHTHAEAKRNLAYNVDTTYYTCWRCHASGYLDEQFSRYPDPLHAPLPEEKPPPALPPNFQPITTPGYHVFMDYLVGRGIHPDAAIAVGAGGVHHGYCHNSVVIPIHDRDMKYGGFVARSIVGKWFHYPPGMVRETAIFNAPAIGRVDPIVVTEGALDALPYYPFGVACLGKPTPAQINILARHAKRVIVCLDDDAKRRAQTLELELRLLGVDAHWLPLPRGMDPNSADRRIIYSAIQGML